MVVGRPDRRQSIPISVLSNYTFRYIGQDKSLKISVILVFKYFYPCIKRIKTKVASQNKELFLLRKYWFTLEIRFRSPRQLTAVGVASSLHHMLLPINNGHLLRLDISSDTCNRI